MIELQQPLLVDSREPELIFKLFEELKIPTKLETLTVGDVQYKETLIFERKEISDFYGSMLSGRLSEQLLALASVPMPFLVIVGSMKQWKEKLALHDIKFQPNEELCYGQISSTILRYGIQVLWLPDDETYCTIVAKICQKFDEEKMAKPNRIRVQYQSRDKRVDRLAVLLGIPVPVMDRLMKRFRSPRMIFAVSTAELMKTEGVGEVTAKKIRAFWDTEISS